MTTALETKKRLSESDSKKKVLEVTFAQIDKQYGKGSIMLLGQTPSNFEDAISTGSILIDHAIGIGGLPRGRIIEVYGPESSGKTTLALHAIAQAQKAGGICAFIDAEHALDPQYARSVGINIDDLVISQPDFGEQALDIAEALVRSGAIDMIVIDSVAALVPKSELDGDMGDVHVGLQARLMSQALRKLTPVVHKSKTVLVFINQVRQNINAMPFAPKEVTTGGKALKFYASMRLEVRRVESIKDKSGAEIGNRVQVKVAKNKVAPPFKKVVVTLIFGHGICREHDLFDAALLTGVIKQSGAWFSMQDEKLGQGRDVVISLLRTKMELADRIEHAVKEILSARRDSQRMFEVAVGGNAETEEGEEGSEE